MSATQPRGWTPERRAAHSAAMRAHHAQRRAVLASLAPPPPPPQPEPEPQPAAPPARQPVSERTAWTEARKLLAAGLSVVEVSRELALPTGRVSDLAHQIRAERGNTPTRSR